MEHNDESVDVGKKLSFGFSKKHESKRLGTSAVQDDIVKVDDDSKDFVLSVERNKVHSSKPVQKQKPKEYVIPLINQNKWRLNASDESESVQNNLDLIAAKEILEESARQNKDWDEQGKIVDSSKAIPLLMQNKVPDGFETDNNLNVDLRPEEPKDADYEEIPIEQFGLALLRGMGWKEGMGIGKNAKMIAPIEAQLRPKGLGLGADKSENHQKDKKSSDVSTPKDESGEKLEFKSGVHCIILSGQHKELYGTIEGIDEDNARVMIKLSVSGKVVNLIQSVVRLVSKGDFEKHSKYLNKLKVDKYKDKEKTSQNGDYAKSSGSSRSRDNGHYKDKDEDKRGYKETRRKYSPDIHEEKGRKHKHKKQKRSKEYNKKHDSYSSSEESNSGCDMRRPWVQKDLRVRIIDKDLKGGKYYKEKVIVEDVPSPDHCVCKTSDGKVIENVSQLSLETVVPRLDDAIVVIVSGSHQGQFGQIMKRDKEKCLALVQMLDDRDVVLKVQYDELCEYVGDVQFME